jgi:16S rRNA (cytosine967-C5)-methyltransferase
MSRYFSYLQTAESILSSYAGAEPFAAHLKKQFAASKKFGSTDRKEISHFCYSFFRLGKAFHSFSLQERIMIGLFLTSTETSKALHILKPEWNELIHLSLLHKAAHLAGTITPDQLFPAIGEVSPQVDATLFAESHLQQPGLFIRVRPGKKQQVEKKLVNAGIAYENKSGFCMVLPVRTKTEELLAINKEVVIQDYSSQQVGGIIKNISFRQQPVRVWDCCAASGGKSILAVDILQQVSLTVSDIRPAILQNLQKRFEQAAIKNYEHFICDLSKDTPPVKQDSFDLVWADVPCTGSGTWGRTPEQLSFFDSSSLQNYTELQKKICSNVIASITMNGYLLYSTCSVFYKENEAMVTWLQEKFSLELVEMRYYKGYQEKADSMFAALLKKKS